MKSLKLAVNGKNIAIAGDSEAVMLSLRCTFSLVGGHAYYSLSAQSQPDDFGKFDYLLWADEVEEKFEVLDLELVDTESPDPWKGRHPSTHWRNKDGESVPVCSFCGKTENEAKYLLSGPGAFICEDCSKVAYETMESKGAY